MANLIGTAQHDHLIGTENDDVIKALGGNDVLEGLGGDDRLTGGTGNDDLSGGDGSDTFIFDAQGFGVDTIEDFDPTDVIDLRGLHIQSYAQLIPYLSEGISDTTIGLDWNGKGFPHNEQIVIHNMLEADFQDANFRFDTSRRDLDLSGNNRADTLFGARGNDTLHGGNGNDALNGGDGSDLLFGDAGDDKIYTGAGNDVVSVDARGFGIDTVYDFTRGHDTIDLELLHVSSFAQLKRYISEYNGSAQIQFSWDGYATEQFLLPGVSMASLKALNFKFDTSTQPLDVSGTNHSDTLFGAFGNDTIHAAGGDIADGGEGDDLLVSELNNNGFLGRGGADTFSFSASTHFVNIILDYAHTDGDIIDVSAIDADTTQHGNQAFTLVDEMDGPGQMVLTRVNGHSYNLYLYTNADDVADAVIEMLAPGGPPVAGDYVF